MAKPTLTVTLPLEVYEQAIATLHAARHVLRNGADIETQMRVGHDCWSAWYALRKAIVHPKQPTGNDAAVQWARESMSPTDRMHYFGD